MRARSNDGGRRLRIAVAVAGLLALLTAAGPLEQLGSGSLTAHMTQHLVLFAVAPPLLILGMPLPARLQLHSDAAWRWVTAGAVLLQSAVMVFWHLPGPFEVGLRHAPVHAVEHASLLAAGLLFWWAIIAAGRRWHYGAAVVAVFIGCLPAIGVGAAMALALHPWWPGFTLADQQMAGVLMWSVGGMIDLVAAVVLFRVWMVAMEPAR